MGIEGDKVDQIIEMHSETVNALKDQISEYKSKYQKNLRNSKNQRKIQTNTKQSMSQKNKLLKILKRTLKSKKRTVPKTSFTESYYRKITLSQIKLI